jgi:hypothetical protein
MDEFKGKEADSKRRRRWENILRPGGRNLTCLGINLPEDAVDKENRVFIKTERANADCDG